MRRESGRRVYLVLGAFALATAMGSPAVAIEPGTRDVKTILDAVKARPLGDRALVRMKMRIRDGMGQLQRQISMRSRSGRDAIKTLIRVQGPADVKGTAFLSVDYRKPDKTDDQWLYMPHLKRVTRVPESGRSGAFLASDFSYADLARPEYDDYRVSLLEASVDVDGEACWLLEAVPKTAAARDRTGYAKTHMWISKRSLVPLRFKSWVIAGRRIKYVSAREIKRVDGIWTPHVLQARTMSGSKVESETTLSVLSVRYGVPEVTDADFHQQRLAGI